ncbi:inositol transporter 4-like isoform X1 [Papaver somniferum]|uniref:inositol transporter 4-like isoform X1 n=1 Tax=Papaver somniferum TaxID=3469 RepID=UPI000E6FE2A9|nr:inositol transporter 4-like isoform X1 [Papaver somniferum]
MCNFHDEYRNSCRHFLSSCHSQLSLNQQGGTHFIACLDEKFIYFTRLAFSAGIGAVLVGYFTGVLTISSLYFPNGFQYVPHANLVIMAIVGAMFGAAFGCWTNDSLGKKRSVLMADVVTFLATMLVAFSSVPSLVVDGTMIVGFGVGMVSMTSSLYILEASPPRLRSSFDCFSSLLIVVGQALSYRVNLFFTEEPRTWSCMIGVVWIPALVQFMLIWFLPESPKWFYREVIAVLVSCFLYSIFYR